MSNAVSAPANDLTRRARAEYHKALHTWCDLPDYAYRREYEAALMEWIGREIEAGRDNMELLIVMALDHETGNKVPYFDFQRGRKKRA